MKLLGGLSPTTFLRRHWQKAPLLVRQAFPAFAGIVDRDGLLALAAREDATSRLVLGNRGRWERHDGPFLDLRDSMLPARRWTLLVHGVESLLPGGWEILNAFSFIPAARLDDLMVSYAAPEGSVGAHDDQYDVFLLQGPGRRRWQWARGGDRALDPRAAIKVLARFEPEEEAILEPGDMLYLPPGVAHWGVAEGGPCFTYSVGFLAPSHEALAQSFLAYLAGTFSGSPELYADPDLRPPRDPLAVGDRMLERVHAVLGGIRWDRATALEFLGRFLTRPRPQARFAPARERRLGGRGRLALALPSRGLVRGDRLFLNGEVYRPGRAAWRLAHELFARRYLPLPLKAGAEARALVEDWLALGWVTLERGAMPRAAKRRAGS